MGIAGGLGESGEARAFRALFQYAPVPICAIDLTGHVFAANHELAALLGFSEEALRGQAITDLRCPEELAQADDLFDEVRQGLRELYTRDVLFCRADGSTVNLRATAILVRGADGEPEFVIGVARPLDDSATAVRGAAHDINNLLTAIAGHAELLLQRLPPDARGRTNAEEIQAAARRSVDVVRSLLEGAPRGPETVDVNDAILGMEKIAKQLVGAGIVVTLQLDAARPHAHADRMGLERAFANLAVNARDAMPHGGTLTIQTCTAGDAVEIVVVDTGSGIDPQLLGRVFDRDFTTKPQGAGHGIGLANVREFAKRYGGSVDVTSEVGAGSTFVLRLPAAVS